MSILLPQVYTAYEVSSLTIEDWLPAGLEALDPNLDNFNGGCGGGCSGCGCGCGCGGCGRRQRCSLASVGVWLVALLVVRRLSKQICKLDDESANLANWPS